MILPKPFCFDQRLGPASARSCVIEIRAVILPDHKFGQLFCPMTNSGSNSAPTSLFSFRPFVARASPTLAHTGADPNPDPPNPSPQVDAVLSPKGQFWTLEKAAKNAGLLPGAGEPIGAAWARGIVKRAVRGGAGALAHFGKFYEKVDKLLHAERKFNGAPFTISGAAREISPREELEAKRGNTVLEVGAMIGTAAGRAGSPRDSEYDHVLSSSPGALVMGKDERLWLWEHKEVCSARKQFGQ